MMNDNVLRIVISKQFLRYSMERNVSNATMEWEKKGTQRFLTLLLHSCHAQRQSDNVDLLRLDIGLHTSNFTTNTACFMFHDDSVNVLQSEKHLQSASHGFFWSCKRHAERGRVFFFFSSMFMKTNFSDLLLATDAFWHHAQDRIVHFHRVYWQRTTKHEAHAKLRIRLSIEEKNILRICAPCSK